MFLIGPRRAGNSSLMFHIVMDSCYQVCAIYRPVDNISSSIFRAANLIICNGKNLNFSTRLHKIKRKKKSGLKTHKKYESFLCNHGDDRIWKCFFFDCRVFFKGDFNKVGSIKKENGACKREMSIGAYTSAAFLPQVFTTR